MKVGGWFWGCGIEGDRRHGRAPGVEIAATFVGSRREGPPENWRVGGGRRNRGTGADALWPCIWTGAHLRSCRWLDSSTLPFLLLRGTTASPQMKARTLNIVPLPLDELLHHAPPAWSSAPRWGVPKGRLTVHAKRNPPTRYGLPGFWGRTKRRGRGFQRCCGEKLRCHQRRPIRRKCVNCATLGDGPRPWY